MTEGKSYVFFSQAKAGLLIKHKFQSYDTYQTVVQYLSMDSSNLNLGEKEKEKKAHVLQSE